MAHIVTTKNSHERTPRMERDAQFKWARGAHPSYPMNKTDYLGVAMIAVTVIGSLAVIVKGVLS